MHENGKYFSGFSWLLVFFVASLAAVGGCAEKPVVKGPIAPGPYTVLADDDLSHIGERCIRGVLFPVVG